MYPSVPTAPEYDSANEMTKMYPPLNPVQGTPYPPPAYSEQPPIPQPSQPAPSTTIVVVDSFPSCPINMKCYYCNEDIKTKVNPKATFASWLLCSLLCLFGCVCGCCLIPFCTNGTRDILHFCPKCKKYLGVHERIRFGRRR